MSIDRLARAKARLEIYTDAEAKLLAGHQSVTLGSRTFIRGDLFRLQEQIRRDEQLIQQHERGGLRARGVVPV